jgi:glucose/arabinose dehydrogenase
MWTRRRALSGAAVVLVLALLLSVRSDRGGDPDNLEATDATTTTEHSSTSTSTSAPSTTVAPTTQTTSAPVTTGAPTTRPSDLNAVSIRLTPVASVDYPIAVAIWPGDGGLWVATKGGSVCRLPGCTSDQIVAAVSAGGEQGLLGITFNPAGTRFYASYTNPTGDSRVDEFTVGGDGTPDVASRREILAVDQPEANHNGGNVLFGPDGYLYLGLGDGGGAGDQHGAIGNAQDPNVDLGKILRIDPAPNPPAVERWISGVRNPWRFTFDRATNDLWVADVGQNTWEEITFLPAGSQQGRNLGWRCFEASHAFGSCRPAGGHTGPIFEYSHSEGCSITGGYVYRGSRIPDLVGAYLFSDYCEGALRALTQSGGQLTAERHLGANPGNVVSFGQDGAGEIYVLTPSAVFRIDPA